MILHSCSPWYLSWRVPPKSRNIISSRNIKSSHFENCQSEYYDYFNWYIIFALICSLDRYPMVQFSRRFVYNINSNWIKERLFSFFVPHSPANDQKFLSGAKSLNRSQETFIPLSRSRFRRYYQNCFSALVRLIVLRPSKNVLFIFLCGI